MEERGHLGKKYEDEANEPSSDLWGKIEPRIEKKRRPFGLLWWLGLSGTMLLFVGLWKAGTETLPVSEKKTVAHTETKAAKTTQPTTRTADELQAADKNQPAQTSADSKKLNQKETTPSLHTSKALSGKQVASAEPTSSDQASPQTNAEYKTENREPSPSENRGKTNRSKKPTVNKTLEALPILAKSKEDRKRLNKASEPTSELAESEDPSPTLLAKTEALNPPAPTIAPEQKQEKAKGEEPPSNEPVKEVVKEIQEPAKELENSPTIPPDFNATVESPGIATSESAKQEEVVANPKPAAVLALDTLKKAPAVDSLVAHSQDSVRTDSSKKEPNRSWSVGFSAAGFYTIKSMSINQNREQNRVRVTNKNALTSDRFAWSASFWFQKKVNSYLSWYASLGVLFLQDQTDFSVQTDSILRFAERTDANGNRFLRPVYSEQEKSVKAQKLFVEAQTGLALLNLFGPVGFKIGPGINYLLWDNRKITGPAAGAQPALASGTNVLPSLHIGMPLSWNFSGGKSLLVEPTATYFFSPAFHPHTGTDITPTLAGLKIGFSW